MLREQIRTTRQGEGGFTLVELLMVVVILGVLAGIAVFAVNGITDKGDAAACKANVTTVTTAVEAYYANQTGAATYPVTADVQTALVPKYLHSWPDGITYVYAAGNPAPVITGSVC